MNITSGDFYMSQEVLEKILKETDFSQYTHLKSILAKKLFIPDTASAKKQNTPLSDEQAELISAAQGIWVEDPYKKN